MKNRISFETIILKIRHMNMEVIRYLFVFVYLHVWIE